MIKNKFEVVLYIFNEAMASERVDKISEVLKIKKPVLEFLDTSRFSDTDNNVRISKEQEKIIQEYKNIVKLKMEQSTSKDRTWITYVRLDRVNCAVLLTYDEEQIDEKLAEKIMCCMKGYWSRLADEKTILRDYLIEREKASSKKQVFVFHSKGEEKTYDFGTLSKRYKKLGAYLKEQTFKGKRIAIVGNNSFEWVEAFTAINIAGCVMVSIDPRLDAKDIKILFEKADVEAAFCDDALIGKMPEFVVVYKMSEIEKYEEEGEKIRDKNGEDYPDIPISPNDDAVILFTSGTTGFQKAIVLSQKSIMNGRNICDISDITDGLLVCMPFFHSAGMCPLVGYLITERLFVTTDDYSIFQSLIKRYDVSTMIVVPAILDAFLKLTQDLSFDAFRTLFGKKFMIIGFGGAEGTVDYNLCLNRLGVRVVEYYGLSETFGPMTEPVVGNGKFNTLYDAVPKYRFAIYEPDECGLGEIIIKKNEYLFDRYLDDEESMSEVIKDGWFHTGDLGRIEDGHIFVMGRIKNTIILANGENVAPEELEKKLNAFDVVRESLVYEEEGKICAKVCLDMEGGKEELEKEADRIKDEINKELPMFMMIRRIYAQSELLERNNTGKLVR